MYFKGLRSTLTLLCFSTANLESLAKAGITQAQMDSTFLKVLKEDDTFAANLITNLEDLADNGFQPCASKSTFTVPMQLKASSSFTSFT